MKQVFAGWLVVACLAGCARSPTIHWHALSPPAPAAAAGADAPLRIVIVSASIPQSIDRPQLLVQEDNGRIALLEAQRWTEPLKRAIPRTLAGFLAQDLGDALVWSSTLSAPPRPDIRIALEIARWHSELGHAATVDLLWTLSGAKGERSGRTVASVPVRGGGYPDLVAAHREGLRIAAKEIAAAVQEMADAHP